MPEQGDSAGGQLLIDLDGFFKPLTEMGELTAELVDECFPLTDAQAARALTLHQLFRSAVVIPGVTPGPLDRVILSRWSQTAAMFAVLGAVRGFSVHSPKWLTFYSDDLHKHFLSSQSSASESVVELTLDRRLVAWTDIKKRKVRVSAITREYLLRINVHLANLSEAVVEEGQVLDKNDSMQFFQRTLEYVMRLHSNLHPSQIPTVRPRQQSSFHFAQRITQIQVGFLISHEFAHLIYADDENVSRRELELKCDTFAFAEVASSQFADWMQFLAVRWLFEILAFDRVLGECLNFSNGDWSGDIDWLQDELRSRRRLEEMLERMENALSPYENVGSIFLLDLKNQLHDLGHAQLKAIVASFETGLAMPSGAEVTARMRDIATAIFADGPISAKGFLSQWNNDQSS
jgi:hypothetical protein